MNDPQLTAIIVGVTGLIRARSPRVDGLLVPAVAALLGGGLAALCQPESWRDGLVHGVSLALAAVGGMTALSYAGTKVGAGLAGARRIPPRLPDAAPALPPGPCTERPVPDAAVPPGPAAEQAPSEPVADEADIEVVLEEPAKHG